MTAADNPFTRPSDHPFQAPPFDRVSDADYLPAYEAGMVEHRREVEAVAADPEEPSFENTVVALERSGRLLARVSHAFDNVISADSSEDRREIQRRLAPQLAAHRDAILLDQRLFARLDRLLERIDELELDDESAYVLRRLHRDFVRAGARLSDSDRDRLRKLNSELSELSTRFSQNALAETNSAAVLVTREERLDGLPENAERAAAEAARARGLDGWLLTFNNFTCPGHLASLRDPELRAEVYRASIGRGNSGGEHDNSDVVLRIATLRARRAALLGYRDHASYVIEDQTAGSVDAAEAMLRKLVPAAVANARAEAAERAELLGVEELAPQDWPYASEQLRSQRFDLDEDKLRPYFELERVLREGVFWAAEQLYGVKLTERTDVPVYHPDVRVFEAVDGDGASLGLFFADFYTRDSKSGGAWMNFLVKPSELLDQLPVVVNNLNISKPPEGEPTLLRPAEVRTMFHEFGHALHGLFSRTRFPRVSGTSVPRDFVEFPSQVNEMWQFWPQVLERYAEHWQTGEPLPEAEVAKLKRSRGFNQGFATVEYLASALLDLAWHRLREDEAPTDVDPGEFVRDFESEALRSAGIDLPQIAPRYRSTYFGHVFAGGYSAGYYAYIWSEVLARHAESWFEEHGGLKRSSGDRFRATLLSKGGGSDPLGQFRDFAGSDPDIGPLLKARGLTAAE